jgi:DNA invertase Pin-like site-specific DNA recombinase
MALQSLLSAALSSEPGFDTILVLDVSRWGRYQDPDQAAHYEFICRQAGIRIVYCGEPFRDDDSIGTQLLKHMKRVMAAEFSRELSAKLTRAHLHLARLGYFQGSDAPYGLRRQLVDRTGAAGMVMKPGQRKAIAGDRVVLIPGPPEEQEHVRRIFRWYAHEGLNCVEITDRLISRGISGPAEGRWAAASVRNVLRNEIYIGYLVYNRTASKLDRAEKPNPKDLWTPNQAP